eukprot:760164-Hanusia_phi.AAC.1
MGSNQNLYPGGRCGTVASVQKAGNKRRRAKVAKIVPGGGKEILQRTKKKMIYIQQETERDRENGRTVAEGGKRSTKKGVGAVCESMAGAGSVQIIARVVSEQPEQGSRQDGGGWGWFKTFKKGWGCLNHYTGRMGRVEYI